MTRDEFWALIAGTDSGDDVYERVEAIQDALCQRTAEEIADFDRHMDELLAVSYSWPLWGAAYLINGGCSDDGFDYFRGWLIAQGRQVFERAVADPDSLADLPELDDDAECETMLYAASNAYETVTGEELAGDAIDLPDLGEGWDFDDDSEMRKRYPKLFGKFGAG